MELTEQRCNQLVEYVAGKIEAARLQVPGIVALGTIKPLAFLISQGMIFMQPIVAPIFSWKRMDEIIAFVGERGNWDRVVMKLETQRRGGRR